MNKSPLRYPGGKTRAVKKLDEIVNSEFDIKQFDTVISPFFGGGSFEFHLQNTYNLKVIANDAFTPLYSFWYACKYLNKNLVIKLTSYLNKITKDDFKEFKDKIMNETNTLNQAVMYFIINRCSFSGSTLSGGFSEESSKTRFNESSVKRVGDLNLNNVELFNLDFEEFLKNKEYDKALIFLDPPYYLEAGSKLYGKNGDMHINFNHKALFNTLQNRKNWILTYNNCDYIKNIYKDYKIIETSWTYGMNKSKQSSEIVIIG